MYFTNVNRCEFIFIDCSNFSLIGLQDTIKKTKNIFYDKTVLFKNTKLNNFPYGNGNVRGFYLIAHGYLYRQGVARNRVRKGVAVAARDEFSQVLTGLICCLSSVLTSRSLASIYLPTLSPLCY